MLCDYSEECVLVPDNKRSERFEPVSQRRYGSNSDWNHSRICICSAPTHSSEDVIVTATSWMPDTEPKESLQKMSHPTIASIPPILMIIPPKLIKPKISNQSHDNRQLGLMFIFNWKVDWSLETDTFSDIQPFIRFQSTDKPQIRGPFIALRARCVPCFSEYLTIFWYLSRRIMGKQSDRQT